jgi:Tol biopolymer transport system component
VYTFESATGTVTRLTSGPSHVIGLHWTPDDRYIFHAGVSTLFAEASGSGFAGWTFYSARPDGSQVIEVIGGLKGRVEEWVLGWHANDQVLMISGYWWCGYFDLRMVDIETGKRVTIWSDQFDHIAYDPVNKMALIWVSPEAVSGEDCGPTIESGLYQVSVPDGRREKVADFEGEFQLASIKWVAEASRFIIDMNTLWALVSLEGEVEYTEEKPIFSPDGKMMALLGYKGESLQILDQDNNLIDIESDGMVLHPTWSPDGKRLFFFVENESKDYDLYQALSPDFEAVLVAKNIFERYDGAPVWVIP